MTKEKRVVLLTSLVISFIVLISLVFSGIKLYQNHIKKDSGTLYIVIKQYEVVDEHFKMFYLKQSLQMNCIINIKLKLNMDIILFLLKTEKHKSLMLIVLTPIH